MKKTKIVCTIGPKSESKEMLTKLLKAGMSVMRLNFSHGSHEEHAARIAALREVKEETGYTLTSYRCCGIVTFVSGNGVTEYMHLFTADGFEGEPIACDEGELEWVDIDKIESLHIWEGDKIFLRLLAEKVPFFSLKLVYDGHDGLISAVLNGKEIKK